MTHTVIDTRDRGDNVNRYGPTTGRAFPQTSALRR